MKRSILLAGITWLLVGCSTPYKSPVFNARNGTLPEFPGIGDLLREERPLDVLLVHGMCTHDADWAKEAVESLFDALGGDATQVNLVPAKVGDTGMILFQQTLSLPAGSLRVNAVLWSPLTTPLKSDLCYDQTNKSAQCSPPEAAKTYPYQRAKFNRTVKDGLLDDCLADALIYQGRSRVAINERMQAAILQAINTTGGQTLAPAVANGDARVQSTPPVVVITDSLGSKVTFDAIFKLADAAGKSKEAGIQLFNRIFQVFMRANQMPILALADTNLDGTVRPENEEAGFPADPIQALIQRRNAESVPQSNSVPRVVSFSDPNDLLAFALVDSPYAARADYPIVDVIVSNDKTYLGLIELPNKAHSDYEKNEAVRQLIACGKPRSSACKN